MKNREKLHNRALYDLMVTIWTKATNGAAKRPVTVHKD